MIISFWGFIKNWRFHMREKCGRVQQTQNSTNTRENSHDDGIMVQIKSQEDNKVLRKVKENYEWTMETFEKIETRLKSLEGTKEFTTRKENRDWNTERFEQMESRLEYLMQKMDQLQTRF
jgi:hypothetical protein